ncbi:MAG: sulfite exporter TauE/SafE family protein [Methylophilaceae bacterium]|nr:sulfite exporter TauE/SafE family protein [Methylophilaceae bacterium]
MSEIQIVATAIGLFVGFVLALTGAGGGLLSVPLLVFFLHLTIARAVPIALLAVMLAAGTAAVLALRAKTVRYKAASLMALCGFAGAPLGIWAAQRLPNDILTFVFVMMMFVVSISMLLQAHRQMHVPSAAEDCVSVQCQVNPALGKLNWTAPCARAMVFVGSLAGFLSGLLGVGGGFIIVPAMRKFTNLDIKSIVATSLAAVALISVAGVIGYAVHGSIAWFVAWPFAVGSVFGMVVGRRVAHRITGPRIQQIFAVFALLVGMSLLVKFI